MATFLWARLHVISNFTKSQYCWLAAIRLES
jgi:hypothetical protein